MHVSEPKSVTFTAIFSKATTLVDGSWRISLDLGEHDGEAVAALARLKDCALQIAVVPIEE